MDMAYIDESSKVIIDAYALDNYATRLFTLYYNKAGFAYQGYSSKQLHSWPNLYFVKDNTGTYLCNCFNKSYCTCENQLPLDRLSIKDRLTKFQSLKCLDDAQWSII